MASSTVCGNDGSSSGIVSVPFEARHELMKNLLGHAAQRDHARLFAPLLAMADLDAARAEGLCVAAELRPHARRRLREPASLLCFLARLGAQFLEQVRRATVKPFRAAATKGEQFFD